MRKIKIFTATGESYWHYHMIGTGVIFNYSVVKKKVITTCENSGEIIDINDFSKVGGLSKDDFKKVSENCYKTIIEQGKTLNLDYMDDPTIVGCIGVDFNLLKN